MSPEEQKMCDERHVQLGHRMDRVEVALSGNGIAGKVMVLETKLDVIKTTQDRLNARVSWLMVAAGALGGLLGHIETILKAVRP